MEIQQFVFSLIYQQIIIYEKYKKVFRNDNENNNILLFST